MIKIKDNVDLKELEKYGFTIVFYWYKKEIKFYDTGISYYVNKDTKQIQIATYEGYDTYLDNTLYDLIKDDLVEKVEE